METRTAGLRRIIGFLSPPRHACCSSIWKQIWIEAFYREHRPLVLSNRAKGREMAKNWVHGARGGRGRAGRERNLFLLIRQEHDGSLCDRFWALVKGLFVFTLHPASAGARFCAPANERTTRSGSLSTIHGTTRPKPNSTAAQAHSRDEIATRGRKVLACQAFAEILKSQFSRTCSRYKVTR